MSVGENSAIFSVLLMAGKLGLKAAMLNKPFQSYRRFSALRTKSCKKHKPWLIVYEKVQISLLVFTSAVVTILPGMTDVFILNLKPIINSCCASNKYTKTKKLVFLFALMKISHLMSLNNATANALGKNLLEQFLIFTPSRFAIN